MKHLIFASFLSLAFLNACGDKSKDNSNTAPPPPTHVNVMAYPYTPFVIRGNQGNMTGFEIEILQAIAAKQNLKLDITPMNVEWDVLFNMLENKQADLLSAGMYPDAERAKRFLVSQPYMYTELVFLNHKNSNVKSFADLRGKRVAVFKDTIAEKELRSLPFAKDIQFVLVNSVYEAVKEVVNNQADVAYGDYVVMSYYAKQFKDKELHVQKNPNAKQYEFVFLIHKDNLPLLEHINIGLTKIKNQGSIERIKQKWLQNENKNEVKNAK